MGNHWHLAVSVENPEQMSRWIHWLCNRHVRLLHADNRGLGGGHVYQGRYKSFPVQDEEQLYTVLRYIEGNPLRAKLVERAEDWPWSSLSGRPVHRGLIEIARPRLANWPRDSEWVAAVNAPLEMARLDLLRRSVMRGTPFGRPEWIVSIAQKNKMESTIRPRGRPRKPKAED
jgi:putative transposase